MTGLRYRLRCTAAERDAIRAASAAAGLSMIGWIRAVVAGERPGIAWPAKRRRRVERREATIDMVLRPEERREWDAAARRHNLRLAGYMRQRLFGTPEQPV